MKRNRAKVEKEAYPVVRFRVSLAEQQRIEQLLDEVIRLRRSEDKNGRPVYVGAVAAEALLLGLDLLLKKKRRRL